MKTYAELLIEKNQLLTMIEQSDDPANDQTVDQINGYLDHVLDFLRGITTVR